MSYVDMATRAGELSSAFDSIARIPKPVVAAVAGYALGGGCEAGPRLRLAGGGPRREAGPAGDPPGRDPRRRRHATAGRLVGPARAKDLVMSGRQVGADEALAIGMVDRVVPAGESVYAAVALVTPYLTGPAQALRAAKLAVDGGLDLDLRSGLAWR